MQRRYNLAHFLLASVVVLGLTPLMIAVEAQAQIAFMSNRDGHVHAIHGWSTYEIYVMDNDGNNQRRLTNNPNDDNSPSWSPDGKRIAFESDRDGHGPFHFEIYVMDADGGNPQNLTNDPNSDSAPSWSPDGKRIVFASNRDGNRDGNRENYEIYVMDADGKNTRRLTNNRVDDKSPSWSSDGKRIVFSSDKKGNHENYEIYVMDADGGNPRNLTNHPEDDEDPAWYNPVLSVAPADKKLTIWGRLKQVDR